MEAYIVGAVESGESVGIGSLAYRKGMRDLEQRVQAESLGEVGAKAGKHVVVEENIALDLLGEVLNGSGIGQAEFCASFLKGVVCVGNGPC